MPFDLKALVLTSLFLALCAALPAAAQSRVGVLGALAPLTDGRLADEVRASLAARGYAVTLLSGDDLADSAKVSAAAYDLLVVPHADTFPAAAQANLQAYLRGKGRLLCVGGPPFTRYAYRQGDRWRTWDSLLEALPGEDPLVAVGATDVAGWTRASNAPSSASTVTAVSTPHGPGVELRFGNFTGWDNFATPPTVSSPYPAGSDLMTFWAKGDRTTDALVIEWREQDGSRWMGSVALTSMWKRYAVAPGDLRYWPDNPSRGRGGPGDHFRPEQARQLILGLANSHAQMAPGPKRLWVADIRAARTPADAPRPDPPVLESLSPWYKLSKRGRADWQPVARYLGAAAVEPPGRLSFVPGGDSGQRQWVYRPYAGPFAGAAWGAANRGPVGAALVQALLPGWRLAHGGPEAASIREGEPVRFVVRVANDGPAPAAVDCGVWVGPVGKSPPAGGAPDAAERVTLAPGEARALTLALPGRPGPGDVRYRIACTDEAGRRDSLENRFTVLPAEARPGPVVTVEGGEFVLDGKPWRPIGVNYWPLWVSGQDAAEFWQAWGSPNQYDPALIERDLALAQRLGMNALSVQYVRTDQAPALLDFLARCRNHGIRANVFVSGGHPLQLDLETLLGLIRAARLWESDAVYAYDVAWEPHVGNHAARLRFDRDWVQWVVDNYGALAKAESEWGAAAPREEGRFSNPLDAQLTEDGPWRRMVAAYRRFMDDRISRGYRQVREAIRAIDPHHLAAARSGYGGNGSVYVEGVMAFDLCAGARHLDFVSPEGYALAGDWRAFLGGGGFTSAYARWAGNGKPVFWAEFGQSIYPQTTSVKVRAQEHYYEDTLRMVVESGANGASGWWWPGGLRLDENSDFGVVAPDGAARPSARTLEQWSPRVRSAPLPPSGPRTEMRVDRDADARGYAGLWLKHRGEYADLRQRGLVPEVRTAGTGTSTADMPLVAVGGAPADGANPLAYANGEFGPVRAEVTGGRTRLTVTVINTGEAAWQASGAGQVVVQALDPAGRAVATAALPRDVPRFGEAALPPFDVEGVDATSTPLTLRLAIVGRLERAIPFGEARHLPDRDEMP